MNFSKWKEKSQIFFKNKWLRIGASIVFFAIGIVGCLFPFFPGIPFLLYALYLINPRWFNQVFMKIKKAIAMFRNKKTRCNFLRNKAEIDHKKVNGNISVTKYMKPDMHASPIPWDYNPSKWSQRIRVAAVGMIAFFIAVYLALYQWRVVNNVWDPFFHEQSMMVLDSTTSHWMSSLFRVPDGALGAWAYLGDVIFALAGSTRRWQYRPWLVIVFGLDVIPLGLVSVILVLTQGFVVKAWCTLCLVTAVISLILIVLAYDEVLTCILYLYRVWKRSKSVSILWKTFIGKPTEIGHIIGEEMLQKRQKNVG